MFQPCDENTAARQSAIGDYILGLDIGAASIGWAIIRLNGVEGEVVRAGSHLFEAGVDGGKMDPETALMRGKEQSRAKPRRDARALRRQIWRRARRKKKVLGALIASDLLPPGDIRTPAAIDAYIKRLDDELRESWANADAEHIERQNMHYRMRAAAATRPVERHELGRALYHLAQRRGFLSNRKTPERDGEERSEMKQHIGELADHISRHDPPTLGAYLASVDPDEQRIRSRWTSRSMYLEEFDRIWSTQADLLSLAEEQRQRIHTAIFHQRPLKDQSHLVGACSLTGGKRCPLGERPAQRFRVLQQVNHLRVIFGDLDERALTRQERDDLLNALCSDGDLTFTKARKAAGLPRNFTFSIERGGEKKLVGQRTDAGLRRIFGAERWNDLSEAEKDAVVHDVRSVREPDVLKRIGRNRWGLDAEAADALGDFTLEEGHAAHSREALLRLIPRMEHDGLSYAEARKDEYPEAFSSEQPHDILPPLEDWDRDLRNPSVVRALTELRKVVNAVVRRWGKPQRIHIELARDLKAGRSKREKIARRMRDREREREAAARAITSDLGLAQPKRWMIEKWLLAEECGWTCPYTGKCFGAHDLLGSNASFDVEHIWPFSRSLDNSYMNKTICHHEENRSRKRGRTPREAYGDDELEAILDRVRAFKGDPFVKREKRRRFTQPMDDGFALRHLQETRYIGRLACDYLGLLYGGRVEAQGTDLSARRIVTPSGGLTAWLRSGWGLHAVLSDRDEKQRNDHRHHAIDAIVIACADQAAIQRVANAAKRMEQQARERPFDEIPEPWDGFLDTVRDAIDKAVVSHRQSRKVRGALHKETLYSKEHNGKRRVRKRLDALSATDIQKERIVDRRALEAIRAKLDELAEKNPAKAFNDPNNLPTVKGTGGRPVALKKVRVEVGDQPRPFGKGVRRRYANPASNHHTRIVKKRNAEGEVVGWDDEPVVLADLAEQVVNEGRTRADDDLVFTLAANEYIEMDRKEGEGRALYRVQKISKGDIEIVHHTDGRTMAERQAAKARDRVSGASLYRRNARKAHVNYLGEISDAGG